MIQTKHDTRVDSLPAGKPALHFGRALASPIGVLVTVPLLVVAVGMTIMFVGRNATKTASESMAAKQLGEQAAQIESDVAFALDQAAPLLERLRVLADRARPVDDVLPRLHDLIVGRPGIAYASLSFPDGTFRGAYRGDKGRIETQESVLGANGTEVHRFTVRGGGLEPLRDEVTDYDPRKRGFYQLAERTGARAWTEPYTFFASHETGITCTEPVLGADGRLAAVLTVDFDVGALSSFVARPGLDEARTIVTTRDGVILAYPAGDQLPVKDKLLRFEDVHDPALDALLARLAVPGFGSELAITTLDASDGSYLASVAPIGGKRAGVNVPLDWYVATIVPTRTLLGPTRALMRSSWIASGGALAIAVGLALVLAWNLVRMRRQVAAARVQARTAEARARELGAYRLVARLGAGGMGEVWRAEHRLLARQAAVKLIRPEAMADERQVPEIRERFRREAQVLASMRSRHTIGLFDYGVTDEGVFYYVMELLDGLDLESLVIRDGAQPAARVIAILIQACSSLAEAHDAGLLHRDIKPPNLYLSRAADEVDIIKLLDFGIVQQQSDDEPSTVAGGGGGDEPEPDDKLTRLGAMLGTPGFMAPEQILGMPLDGRADLYALGCVAWWLLTGKEVFPRSGPDAKILHKHINDPIPPLRTSSRNWIPLELERVVEACLAKEPERRPSDARALAALLRAIPIPAEHAWTEARAAAWWNAYKPPAAAPRVRPSEVQVIMPLRSDVRPPAATEELAISPTLLPTSKP